MITWIKRKYREYKAARDFKKKLDILKKREPFRYKNF